MDGLTFDELRISLPAYAIGLMQNLSKADQDLLYDRIEDVRKSPQEDRMKVMSLGLLVLDAVGEAVLDEAVQTVRKELGHAPLPSTRPGFGPISDVFRRPAAQPAPTPAPAASVAATAAPPTLMKVADVPSAAVATPTIASAAVDGLTEPGPSGGSATAKASPGAKAKADPKPTTKATVHS
jgi:hypothetical protein